ncbi:MAG: arsenite methyltransferase [Actinobacteria bacterium]|nr:arsenite methyltransferase [Actinomycetota bacterium]
MDNKQVKDLVKNKYGEIAKKSTGCDCSCGCGSTNTDDYAQQIGYGVDDLSSVPNGANLGLGCGNPTAITSIKTGETILDLGSGAGFDAFLAAKAVGESGKVIGVDMTPEMIAKAKENAVKSNYHNVEFKLGEIEHLPVEDNSIDAIISNCVINLSPDKPQVFKEAYRVLKQGGRLMVSDIVLEQPLPDDIRKSIEAYVGCIAGASLKQEYIGAIEKAGFKDVSIVGSIDWLIETNFLKDEIMKSGVGKTILQGLGGNKEKITELAKSVKSIKVLAWKK